MAAQILHKTTEKHNIYKYQACWDIVNFGTFYPMPIAHDENISIPIPSGSPVHQSRLPAQLISPAFKFKMGNTENFIEPSLKLLSVLIDDDYRLWIETTVLWTKGRNETPWGGDIQIDLLNSDGQVVDTPLSADMLYPVYQSKVGVKATLGAMWMRRKDYFADDILRLRVSLTLFGKNGREQRPRAANRLAQDMLALLESESRADVILICNESVYKAHSAILAARSPAFVKMIKVAGRDADTGKISIQIKDVKPLILRSILRFLYATEFELPSSMPRIAWICQMLKAADAFELDEIKPLCYDTIRANLSLHSCGEMAVKAWERDADPESKRIISDYLTKHWAQLIQDPDFVSTVNLNPTVFVVQTTARALKTAKPEKKMSCGLF